MAAATGAVDSESNIVNKLSRGKFTAVFLTAMLRTYRGIILAIAGLASMGASEPPKQSAQQAEIVATLKSIAAPLQRPEKPDQTTRPCDPEKEDRNSDLCAQWKAADAADTAAWWARVSGVLSVAGLFGVAGALMLTRQSNRIASLSAHHELRPYIYLPFPQKMLPEAERRYISENERAKIFIKNYGKTPARNVKMYVHCVVRGYTSHNFPKAKAEMTTIQFGDIPPEATEWYDGQEITGTVGHRPALNRSEEAIHIDGLIEYEDSSGETYVTNFRLVSFGEAFQRRSFMKSHHGNVST